MGGGVNQLFKVQNCLIKIFTKYGETIQTNHASKLNFHPSKLLINQYAEIKHIKSTHNKIILRGNPIWEKPLVTCYLVSHPSKVMPYERPALLKATTHC